MRAVTLLLALLLPACASAPKVPEVVEVIVEKDRELPDWATRPLPRPERGGPTVRHALENEAARGDVIDLANCHRALLRKLSAGQVVEEGDCGG